MKKLYIAVDAKVSSTPRSHRPFPENPGGHITLAFMDVAETDKLYTCNLNFLYEPATVVGVEYWAHSDVTVLLIDAECLLAARDYLEQQGFTYDHDFIPHITVAKGNKAKDYKDYICCSVSLEHTYLRVKDFS
ncbi:hypothetical protein KIT04_020 [Vibrio phage KIT04]|nr:hypothetical protein KIT04_020 [Vibrio phage KIT04]